MQELRIDTINLPLAVKKYQLLIKVKFVDITSNLIAQNEQNQVEVIISPSTTHSLMPYATIDG